MTTYTARIVAAELLLTAERHRHTDGTDHTYVRPTPDYGDVGPSCLYAHKDGPGCLIGTWVAEMHNVPLAELAAADDNDGVGDDVYDQAALSLRRLIFGALGIDGTHPDAELIYRFCADVQTAQDQGTPWVEAVTREMYRRDWV